MPKRWLEGQEKFMARMQETDDRAATWSAVRKLIRRKNRASRPPASKLGDGKPLLSLRAKDNQHQRDLMKEFGENCRNQRGGTSCQGTSGQASGPCRARRAGGCARHAQVEGRNLPS